VTEADVAAEAAIVATLRAAYPDDALWAEESAPSAALQGGPTWIVDPIDGTKQFMRGIPFFATLVALALEGQPVVGVSYAPALDELLVAVRGGGATCNGEAIGVSALSELGDSFVAFGPLEMPGLDGYAGALRALGRDALGFRGFGDFYGYHLVARGLAEVMIEPEVAPWDVAALKVIVEEAGGVYSDFAGDRRVYGTGTAGGSLATNGRLHGTVLDMLQRHGAGFNPRDAGSNLRDVGSSPHDSP
jgi:histidinol-phosphatase